MLYLLSLAFTFFLVANPIGNSPAILALIKDFPLERQKKIMLREGIFSFFIAIFFQFFGEDFLTTLHIQNYTVSICGGILLLLVAFSMFFKVVDTSANAALKKEPFIVPIATPLISGPGLLAIIMIYSKEEPSSLVLSTAIFIAWIFVIGVLVVAPFLQKLLGKKGLLALEQLMGLIISMIAVGLIIKGAHLFIMSL